MKLLYCAFDPVPWPKGSGTRIEATVRALAKAGAQVHLHTPLAPRSLDGFPERLEVENVEHRPVVIDGENFLERALAFRESVELLVSSLEFDRAIFRSLWEGLPILKHVPVAAFEAHGFPSIELPSHHPGVEKDPQFLDRLIGEENACIARAALYITPSVTNRHFLMRRGAHPGKIHVIPNSVSIDNLPEPSPASALEDGPFRIGYMGTMAPWQGLGTLIEAVGLLSRKVPCQIVLAGTRKGRWMRNLRNTARSLRIKKCLEFHGPLGKDDLFEVLQSCHVLAAPLPNDPRNGLQGCCPIKILEYMTCRRPIISTRITPVQEILEHEVTAYLVRPGSSQALAAGLDTLYQEAALRDGLAERAFEHVGRHYRRGVFDGRVAELWERLRLVGRGRGGTAG